MQADEQSRAAQDFCTHRAQPGLTGVPKLWMLHLCQPHIRSQPQGAQPATQALTRGAQLASA